MILAVFDRSLISFSTKSSFFTKIIAKTQGLVRPAQLTVSHSRFQSFHARDLLVRGSKAVIEDNEFYDTVMAGILAGPEFTWNEGPRVENIVVRRYLFRNVSGSNILVEDAADSTGIKIEQNRFVGYGRYRHGVMGDPAKLVLMEGK